MFLILLGGVFLSFIVFMFTFISSKKSGKYYLAPIVTFLFSIGIAAYSIIVIRGFEGMGYLFLAAGFLITSVIVTIFLPKLIRRKSSKQFKRSDKFSLVFLPIIFFSMIGLVIYSDQGYWIINQGSTDSYAEIEGYRVSTISEGNKQVSLLLGKDYTGKKIEVENVSKRGPTEITVNILEGEEEDKTPFIEIGLDEINEPLKVQTTEGLIFEPLSSNPRN
ncbi:hypothetical protein [Oceanobacillus iheyensis HTE831]|uniref:YesK-like protein n=1 Tax=Oceanobacillus iheyensis (strain DSM 14371 / CIP 107618 / JCM 11309 / KCTC 3954 / HTE831) TaxID=221109 RepID=Q8ERQ1_OCEIH|nr:hypothetical protein [Oceanobacillus iheyensis]BAC13206.1 hypothetical protein [Oceanobacillus iheyensis HTE831]